MIIESYMYDLTNLAVFSFRLDFWHKAVNKTRNVCLKLFSSQDMWGIYEEIL